MIPPSNLPDRVDILAREQVAKDQRASVRETVVASNVPCLIARTADRGAAVAAVLGFNVAPALRCTMNVGRLGRTALKPGYQLREKWTRKRYTVGSVDLYPNDTRPEFQQAELTEVVAQQAEAAK